MIMIMCVSRKGVERVGNIVVVMKAMMDIANVI